MRLGPKQFTRSYVVDHVSLRPHATNHKIKVAESFCITGETKTAMKEMSSQDELKRQTGYRAVDDYVKSGMVVGLGTGSTAYFAVERLGQLLASGELKDIVAIPTSIRTKEQAESLKRPLVTLDTHPRLDVAIDGADEVDPDVNLVKGGGGALLREKMVELSADKFIVIGEWAVIDLPLGLSYLASTLPHIIAPHPLSVDESKLRPYLGPGFPIPVEITPFSHLRTIREISSLPSCRGCDPILRMGSVTSNSRDGENIAITDNGNYIVDLHFVDRIVDVPLLADELKSLCGVVDHGIFCDMTHAVICAGVGGVVVRTPPDRRRNDVGGGGAKILRYAIASSAAVGLLAMATSAFVGRRR